MIRFSVFEMRSGGKFKGLFTWLWRPNDDAEVIRLESGSIGIKAVGNLFTPSTDDYGELITCNKANLDNFWLRDESLEEWRISRSQRFRLRDR